MDDDTVYENVTSECKEKTQIFENPNSKDSFDVDVESCLETIKTIPRLERRISIILSENSERKESILKERILSTSSTVEDSIGEDDEVKVDSPDIENPNPRMETRSSMVSSYQKRKEKFSISESLSITDIIGENSVERTTPRPRLERRKSSISSIVQNANIETITAPKPKPCIPMKVEIPVLVIFVIVCLVIVWSTILPLAGSDVYQGLVTRRLRSIPQNLSLPSIRLLDRLNISNLTVACPEMFIFSPKDNSCKPQCGAWSGCGRSMYYVEKYSLAIIDCVGIIVGIFGFVSWLLDYKHWEWRHFAIVISTKVAFVSSIAFAFLDLPGSKYLYCSNEEKPFTDVADEGNMHIQVYSAVLAFLSYSFLLWLCFSLINISLSTFFALSITLQKKSFTESFWLLSQYLHGAVHYV